MMKAQRVYQYQELPKEVSTSKMAYTSCGVYVYCKSIKDGIARCKVLLVKEQPKGNKFKERAWVYIPTQNLIDSDLYPHYVHNPSQWLRLINKPVIEAALEILEEISPSLAVQVTAAINKRDLKVGQEWKSSNQKLVIEKQWDQYLIVRDKFGDRQKYTREELSDKLNNSGAKLSKSFDAASLLKALAILLTPFMGIAALTLLLKVVESYIKK